MQNKKKVIIIGAGPAGLTAAYEFTKHPDYEVEIFESSDGVGGISRTFEYKGNRIDIGGHRFFSKSDRVMQWWQDMLPIQKINDTTNSKITYHHSTREVVSQEGPDPDTEENLMLIRPRLSRIYYLRKFFKYPVSLSVSTLKNLGFSRVLRIGVSYLAIRLFPLKKENNLEDFFINRFGVELYSTFFKDYTKKVWGIAADGISAEWGRQRIKGLSITAAIKDAIKKILFKDGSIGQKNTETSLIEQFLYPKYGPGQMWETVQKKVEKAGGVVYFNHKVTGFLFNNENISQVIVMHNDNQKIIDADYIISSMPVSGLIKGMGEHVPAKVQDTAFGLKYRAFVTVGILMKKLLVTASDGVSLIPDTWIYVQEPEVKIGRIQIFNNWSLYLVNDPETVWVGLEYFCDEGDAIWSMSDEDMISFALDELALIDFVDKSDFLDAVVIRVPKTYPTYFGAYDQFDSIREFVDTIPNLFLVGRNGMHRYNNQDHSMLTAMTAVENIVTGRIDKSNIWDINVEQEYHEEK